MSSLYNHPKYIPDRLCKIESDNKAIEYFSKAYFDMIGKDELNTNYNETIAILVAHCSLETGHFKIGLHCYNFGNTRCNPDKLGHNEYFTMFKCGEIIKGKEILFEPPDPGSVFQAFKSAEEGIKHHLRFLLKDRYWNAWQAAIDGDPKKYVHELKKGNYFTANEARYTNTLVNLYNQILPKIKI
jgi:hypothetical protein